MNTIWTEQEFIDAVKSSISFVEVAKKLGYTTYGSNIKTINKYIKSLNLDTSHFLTKKEQLQLARQKKIKISYEELFCVNDIDRKNIKKIIIRDNLIPYQCKICSITEWNGQKLSLHLDHINGINNDNELNNLRFLCPNCHSLTESYCGKKLKGIIKIKNSCINCGIDINSKSKRCLSCSKQEHITKKIIWPNEEEFTAMVLDLGYQATANKLGVNRESVKRKYKK